MSFLSCFSISSNDLYTALCEENHLTWFLSLKDATEQGGTPVQTVMERGDLRGQNTTARIRHIHFHLN